MAHLGPANTAHGVLLTATAREQVTLLTAARNADGGWGYGQHRASRLEPTCLASLALNAAGVLVDASVLRQWPREGGLLIDPHSRTVNGADNGIALLTAQHSRGAEDIVASLVPALAAMKGIALPPAPATSRQDNALRGWPWAVSTFSWVEPTAWCVLALKKWLRGRDDPATAARVAEGERLLLDRVCHAGGWNYGNSNILGKELFPYIPTTGIALLALQDRRDHEVVRRSVDYLASHCRDERSGLSLSLSRIALGVLGARIGQAGAAATKRVTPHADLNSLLSDTWRTTQYLGNIAATALALYAEAGAADDYGAFRI